MNDSREQEGVHTKEQRERQLEPDGNLASKNRKQGVPISKQCASKEDSPDGVRFLRSGISIKLK